MLSRDSWKCGHETTTDQEAEQEIVEEENDDNSLAGEPVCSDYRDILQFIYLTYSSPNSMILFV
jgi:hypothetical protein